MSDWVYATTVFDGDLIAGGKFSWAGGVPASHVARWNGSSWAPLGSGMGGSQGQVMTLGVYGNDVVAGGIFSSAGGVGAGNIARWTCDGRWLAYGAGTAGSSACLPVFAGTGSCAGSGSLPLAIPDDPALVGLSLYAQGLFLDVAAPAGVPMSNGMRRILG